MPENLKLCLQGLTIPRWRGVRGHLQLVVQEIHEELGVAVPFLDSPVVLFRVSKRPVQLRFSSCFPRYLGLESSFPDRVHVLDTLRSVDQLLELRHQLRVRGQWAGECLR